MRRRPLVPVTAAAALVLLGGPATAASAAGPAEGAVVEVVLDASGSMREDAGDGRTKLAAAQEALRTVVQELPGDARVGLRAYGHRVPEAEGPQRGCQDTELLVPVGPLDRTALTTAVAGLQAVGWTPIGRALQEAARDLDGAGGAGERTVVLVSDGVDTCAPPEVCDVARDLAADGVGLTVETVGFQVDAAAREELECIAEVTGGSYRDASDTAALQQQLVAAASRAVRSYAVSGTAVEGGASWQDAPVLEPGVYSDTVLAATEELWYAVELEQGQSLTARPTLVLDGGEWGRPGSSFATRLVGEDLDEVSDRSSSDIDVYLDNPTIGRTVSQSVTVGPVGTDTRPAGTYYVRLVSNGESGLEYPVELSIEVEGADGEPVAPTAGATTEAAPDEAPDETGDQTAAGAQQDAAAATATATPGWVWAVVGVLGTLVVLLGAAVAVLARRPRR